MAKGLTLDKTVPLIGRTRTRPTALPPERSVTDPWRATARKIARLARAGARLRGGKYSVPAGLSNNRHPILLAASSEAKLDCSQ